MEPTGVEKYPGQEPREMETDEGDASRSGSESGGDPVFDCLLTGRLQPESENGADIPLDDSRERRVPSLRLFTRLVWLHSYPAPVQLVNLSARALLSAMVPASHVQTAGGALASAPTERRW